MKTTLPIEHLSPSLPLTKDVPVGLVRIIGTSEFPGVLGLILPSLLRIKPLRAPVAALGIMAIMVMAAIFHVTGTEFSGVVFTVILASVADFIGLGRWMEVPIQSKMARLIFPKPYSTNFAKSRMDSRSNISPE